MVSVNDIALEVFTLQGESFHKIFQRSPMLSFAARSWHWRGFRSRRNVLISRCRPNKYEFRFRFAMMD